MDEHIKAAFVEAISRAFCITPLGPEAFEDRVSLLLHQWVYAAGDSSYDPRLVTKDVFEHFIEVLRHEPCRYPDPENI